MYTCTYISVEADGIREQSPRYRNNYKSNFNNPVGEFRYIPGISMKFEIFDCRKKEAYNQFNIIIAVRCTSLKQSKHESNACIKAPLQSKRKPAGKMCIKPVSFKTGVS